MTYISKENIQNNFFEISRTEKKIKITNIISKVRTTRKKIKEFNISNNLIKQSKIEKKLNKMNEEQIKKEFIKLHKKLKKEKLKNKKLIYQIYSLKKSFKILNLQFFNLKELYNKLYSKYIKEMELI